MMPKYYNQELIFHQKQFVRKKRKKITKFKKKKDSTKYKIVNRLYSLDVIYHKVFSSFTFLFFWYQLYKRSKLKPVSKLLAIVFYFSHFYNEKFPFALTIRHYSTKHTLTPTHSHSHTHTHTHTHTYCSWY